MQNMRECLRPEVVHVSTAAHAMPLLFPSSSSGIVELGFGGGLGGENGDWR